MQIGQKDLFWNYAATFLQIGAGVILLPFILRMFPQETVAIWTIFSSIIAISSILDFGFNPSFTRNVSYIVSGVKELKKDGYQTVESNDSEIDYSLFKGLINAMRWFYGRMAFILFALLITAGSYYIYIILKNYSGSHIEIYISWFILCFINSYLLYTTYYDALLQGQGLVKKSKQIQMIGHIIYLLITIILIILHFNLIAIVSAQALSIIVRRLLSYKTIYTPEFKQHLHGTTAKSHKDILKLIYLNAVKIGITSFGGFLVARSSVIIGSLYLPLETIASYGITIQIISIIAGVGTVFFFTYQPKIIQHRIQNNISEIKKFYVKACLISLIIYIICGTSLLCLGDWLLYLFSSKTPLLNKSLIGFALLISFLETNHGIAMGFLLTKNEVPFFKAALLSGGITVLLLFIFFKFLKFGVWGMVLAPGIVQGCYQNWRWPMFVIKEFNKKLN